MKIKFSSVKDHNFKYQIPLGQENVFICQSPIEIIEMYYGFLYHRSIYYFMNYEKDVSEIHKYNKDFAIKIVGLGQNVFLCVKINTNTIKGSSQEIWDYYFKNKTDYAGFDVPVSLEK